MICVTIDELAPCLTDAQTGDRVETEVVRIRRKSFLQKFTKRAGWYVNGADLVAKCEVYALVVRGTMDIQGLVAVEDTPDYGALYISWAVASPSNNPELCESKRYNGVGGHLLAIAIDRSEQLGYGGDVTGFCRNKSIMDHFVKEHGAMPLRMLHEYQIAIYGEAADKIRRNYDYEWTDEEV